MIRRLLFVFICGIGMPLLSHAHTSNVNHPANLKITHKLACLGTNQVISSYTPADLKAAVVACAKAKRFDDAISIHFVLLAFARFDAKKMSDPSARAALGMINHQMASSLSKQEGLGMHEAAQRLAKNGEALHLQSCEEMMRIGPPTYQPIYMAAHGLKAFDTSNGALRAVPEKDLVAQLKEIDEARAWKNIVSEWGKC